jgi:hypothetical protein
MGLLGLTFLVGCMLLDQAAGLLTLFATFIRSRCRCEMPTTRGI